MLLCLEPFLLLQRTHHMRKLLTSSEYFSSIQMFQVILACTASRVFKWGKSKLCRKVCLKAAFSFLFQGTSVCQAILVGSVVALLYSSRACYNLVAVAISPDSVPGPFNYGWDNLSDKVSLSPRVQS